jgi:hypothetical protein
MNFWNIQLLDNDRMTSIKCPFKFQNVIFFNLA